MISYSNTQGILRTGDNLILHVMPAEYSIRQYFSSTDRIHSILIYLYSKLKIIIFAYKGDYPALEIHVNITRSALHNILFVI